MKQVVENDRIARRAFPVMIIGLLVVALSGCASAASDTGAQSTDSEVGPSAVAEANEDAPDGADGDATARLGTITVDTTTYSVIESINCELVQSSDVATETFSSIAVGQSAEGDDVLFFAYTQEQSGGVANFIDYQGPEGTWTTQEGNATFTLSGGILSGASVIVNGDASQSKMIQFKFALPEELAEC